MALVYMLALLFIYLLFFCKVGYLRWECWEMGWVWEVSVIGQRLT